jgi:D-lactate dehydrogenase
VLNPGVVLNRDPHVHLENLKTQPLIEESAAHCVECGFCEPVCPSRNVTTTPRQRIVIRREMARQEEGSPVYEALLADYEYDALQTCAADGSCKQVCPVAIDTGALVKELRRRERTPREESVALALARRYGIVERAARAGLSGAGTASAVLGHGAVAKLPELLRRRVSSELVPTLPAALPHAAPARLPETTRGGAAAVYLPACINRIFGNPAGAADEQPTLPQALVDVSARAGAPLWIPPDAAGHCCATPWSSKGYRQGQDYMAAKTADTLWRWSGEGELPVVIDASSCSQGLLQELAPRLSEQQRERFEQVEVLDSIAWAHDRLLPRLQVTGKVASAAVHPTCAATQLGLAGKLEALAGALAERVLVPAASSCCGMAGDRGLLHPELPASATRDVATELADNPCVEHLCSNRTCEIALAQTTGESYESFVLLLERLTRT